VDFDLPGVTFDVSAKDWEVPSSNQIADMVCAGPAALGTDCCAPPDPSLNADCQTFPIACDPESSRCATIFDVPSIQSVDLMTTALAGVQGRVLSFVELVSLSTTYASAVPALPIRAASLYVGPLSMVSPASPGATYVGQVSLQSSPDSVQLGVDAEQAFSAFATDYPSAFQFLLSVHVQVPAGSVPTGKETFPVSGRATAYY
jgi:hypothetical protein